MPDEIRPIISEPFETVDDVLDGLTELEGAFRASGDDRAIFVTAYRRMTLGIAMRLDGDFFTDTEWVREYLVEFGEDYRTALVDWERGDRQQLPDAWELSFAKAESNEALVLQDLILGVSAHINHDLPFALETVGVDRDRSRKYNDHTRVNRIIAKVIDAVQNGVVNYYSRSLGHLDAFLGPVDETLTHFSLAKAREHAWSHGVALSNASNPDERRRLHSKIDDAAETIARIVLAPTELPPFVADAIEFIDGDGEWLDDAIEDVPPVEAILDSPT